MNRLNQDILLNGGKIILGIFLFLVTLNIYSYLVLTATDRTFAFIVLMPYVLAIYIVAVIIVLRALVKLAAGLVLKYMT